MNDNENLPHYTAMECTTYDENGMDSDFTTLILPNVNEIDCGQYEFDLQVIGQESEYLCSMNLLAVKLSALRMTQMDVCAQNAVTNSKPFLI